MKDMFFSEFYNTGDYDDTFRSQRSQNDSDISRTDIEVAIKRCRARSSPSPVDQVGYDIFKK